MAKLFDFRRLDEAVGDRPGHCRARLRPCRGGGLGIALLGKAMVEPIGIEPMTSSLQS